MFNVYTATLYQVTSRGFSTEVDQRTFERLTPAYERQIADDLAKEHNLRFGEGYVVITDPRGEVVDTLELPF